MERTFNKKGGRRFRAGILFCSMLLLLAAVPMGQPEDTESPGQATLKQLSIAYSQHEIVQLLIQKGDYEKAIEEYKVILDLKLPGQYEDAVFKEIVIVTKKLYELGQKELAYTALMMGFGRLQTIELKARVLNVKASLLKKDGKLDKAIQTYKEEVTLREKALGE